MRISTSTPGSRFITQATINNNNTIGPNTAVVDLLRISGVPAVAHQAIRIRATGWVTLTGTTNTVRTVFFTLVHGAGNTVLAGGPVSLAGDEAATSLSVPFSLDYILEDPVANLTDEFAVRWSTGANATANVNGTVLGQGGMVFNIEQIEAANVNVSPGADELLLDTARGTDPINLLTSIGGVFARALAASPDVQVVDMSCSGGGAGNVYMAEFIFRLPQIEEDVSYPRLADLIAAIGWGQDSRSMHFSSIRWIDAFPSAELNFWADACSGDGAQFIQLFLFVPNDDDDEEGGEGLLAARIGESMGRALPGSMRSVIRVRDLVAGSDVARTERPGPLTKAEAPLRASAGHAPIKPRQNPVGVTRRRFESSPRKPPKKG